MVGRIIANAAEHIISHNSAKIARVALGFISASVLLSACSSNTSRKIGPANKGPYSVDDTNSDGRYKLDDVANFKDEKGNFSATQDIVEKAWNNRTADSQNAGSTSEIAQYLYGQHKKSTALLLGEYHGMPGVDVAGQIVDLAKKDNKDVYLCVEMQPQHGQELVDYLNARTGKELDVNTNPDLLKLVRGNAIKIMGPALSSAQARAILAGQDAYLSEHAGNIYGVYEQYALGLVNARKNGAQIVLIDNDHGPEIYNSPTEIQKRDQHMATQTQDIISKHPTAFVLALTGVGHTLKCQDPERENYKKGVKNYGELMSELYGDEKVGHIQLYPSPQALLDLIAKAPYAGNVPLNQTTMGEPVKCLDEAVLYNWSK